MNIHCGELLQVGQTDRRIGREKPAIRGDDIHAGPAGRRPGESFGVGELAPKVEPAEKAEHFADRNARARLEARGKRKLGAGIQ